MNTMIRYTQPVSTLLEALFSGLKKYSNRRASIRELSALPDWQLNDIGVVRANIPVLVDRMLAEAAARQKVAVTATPIETKGEEHHVARSGVTA